MVLLEENGQLVHRLDERQIREITTILTRPELEGTRTKYWGGKISIGMSGGRIHCETKLKDGTKVADVSIEEFIRDRRTLGGLNERMALCQLLYQEFGKTRIIPGIGNSAKYYRYHILIDDGMVQHGYTLDGMEF